MYFNQKYERTGSLLEGPFRAKHIGDDTYLQYLYAYIHLNPVKIKDPEAWSNKRIVNPITAEAYLDQYRFSSYDFYKGKKRSEDSILNSASFPDYFSEKKDFSAVIKNWINFDDEEPLSRRGLAN